MYLTHLSLTNFRTFARLDIEIPRRVILLIGDNAQGKTSFLEAVYFLATLTSFQTRMDRQLVNFLAAREPLAVTRLVGEYRRGDSRHRIEARLILESVGANARRLRKEILLDGVKRSLAEAIGHFNAVLFVPQMTQIIEGGPEERRRYLNLTLAQAVYGYARLLGEYRQTLTQRNALLKQIAERGGDTAQLAFWDEKIADLGARIIHHRIQAVQELEQQATRIHHHLTRASEVLRLNYQPAFDPLPAPRRQYALPLDTPVDRSGLKVEEIRDGFLERLRKLHGEEIARGVTTIGPHRDELRFLSNGVDLGYYGSRGQIRTALLSLKLAEVAWLKEKTGEWPVILLDEIMAELDAQRRADLQDYLRSSEQVILTSTDASAFGRAFLERATLWKVEGGTIRAAE